MTYDIEITDFAPGPRTSRTVMSTADEAWTAVRAAADIDGCVLLVGAMRETSATANSTSGWQAIAPFVRLDEHRDWYAADPAWVASAAPMDTWFRDADGLFAAQNAETLSRAQAVEALEYWLRTGKMLPSLTWA